MVRHWSVKEDEDLVVNVLKAISEGRTVQLGVENFLEESGNKDRTLKGCVSRWNNKLIKRYEAEVYTARDTARHIDKSVIEKRNQDEMLEMSFQQFLRYVKKNISVVDPEGTKAIKRVEELERLNNKLERKIKSLESKVEFLETKLGLAEQERNTLLTAFNIARQHVTEVPKSKMVVNGNSDVERFEVG